MNCFICYFVNISHVRNFETADKKIAPVISKFESFCNALGVSCYVQRNCTFRLPVFYRFEMYFSYSTVDYRRFSTAFSIFAEIYGLSFGNEIFSIDGKECYSERGHILNTHI